jgi:protein-disulfide isomerase
LTPAVSTTDHAEGAADAEVTLVEYGDYECSHCRQAFPIVKRLQKHFGSRLRFVFRHFPLTRIHPHAQHAAEAAEAAAAQGRFRDMHDLLLHRQRALSDPDLVRYAAEIGLDAARVEEELEDHTHARRIREDIRSGEQSGVSGTPTFFLNGLRHDGDWDLDALMEAVEAAARRQSGLNNPITR